jgi:hypothetical protein
VFLPTSYLPHRLAAHAGLRPSRRTPVAGTLHPDAVTASVALCLEAATEDRARVTMVVPRWRRPALVATAVVWAAVVVLGWQAVRRVNPRLGVRHRPAGPPVAGQLAGHRQRRHDRRRHRARLAYGPLRRHPASAAGTLAAATGAVALPVDVYPS